MTSIARHKAALGALAAAVSLAGIAAVAPSANASSTAPPQAPTISYGGGAVDSHGHVVDTGGVVVTDHLPTDVGQPICSGTVAADGTVLQQQGSCDGLENATP